jgi:hypothetical protein
MIAMAGPVVFIVIVAFLTALEWGFLRHLGWDPVRGTDVPWPSSTALGDYGWLQVLNFTALGLSVIALALGLWRELSRRPVVGLALLFVSGVATLMLGFKTDPSTSRITSWHGAIHAGAFVALLVSVLITMFIFAARLRLNRRWDSTARYSLIAGVLSIAFVLASILVPAVGGLFGSLALLTILAWLELLSVRLNAAAGR